MKTRIMYWPLAATLGLLLMAAGIGTAIADEAPAKAMEGTVADSWIMWPKAGEEMAFETALKQHAAWRKSAGEGFVWSIYQPIVGSDLTFYVVRTGNHTWKDFDTQDAWESKTGAVDKFQQQVGPHVTRLEHYFSETDTKHSHWIESKDYRYFGATTFYLKYGMGSERSAALDKIHQAVSDAKWPYAFAIHDRIGGSGAMQVVTPMKDYAGMADPEPSMRSVLAKSVGSDAAAAETFKQFGSSIDHTDYTVYKYRLDLSTPQ